MERVEELEAVIPVAVAVEEAVEVGVPATVGKGVRWGEKEVECVKLILPAFIKQQHCGSNGTYSQSL